jgi:hypothetical protein
MLAHACRVTAHVSDTHAPTRFAQRTAVTTYYDQGGPPPEVPKPPDRELVSYGDI